MQSFTELALDADILETLANNKYETPTPIQAETLPILLGEPTDFLGLAATGTGKTLAFGLPLVQKITAKDRHPQALILCPTRELAQQVSLQIQLLGKSRRLNIATVFGGAGYGDQIKSLRAGAHVVVATPGRLVDHLERGTVNLSRVQTVILDEADEMISMGFKDDLELILSRVKEETAHDMIAQAEGDDDESVDSSDARTAHIWLFSATMSADVKKVAHKFLKSPKTVQINSKTVLSGTVEQLYYMTKETDKPEILGKIIDVHDGFYGLVFCQTKLLVQSLTTLLQSRGYKVDSLHGDKPQTERERILARFRARDLQIVICTDVAARGLDVKDLTHVVNYSIPRELENYIHRIGRTGRSGSKGIAISLVTPSHLPLIGRIEKITKTRIDRGTVPSNSDVGKKKVARIVTKFKAAQNWEKAQTFLEENFKEEIGDMSATEMFARVLATQHADLFQVRELRANKLMSNGETLGENRARGPRPQQFDGRDRRPERREWTPSRGGGAGGGEGRRDNRSDDRRGEPSRPSFNSSADRDAGSPTTRPSFRSEGAAPKFRSEGSFKSEGARGFKSEGRPSFGSERRGDSRGGSSEGKRSFGTFRTFETAASPADGGGFDRPARPRRSDGDDSARPARRGFGAGSASEGATPTRREGGATSLNSRREFGERKFGSRKSSDSAVADRPRRTAEEGVSIRDKYKTKRSVRGTEHT